MSMTVQGVDDIIWGRRRNVYEERVIFVDLVIEELGEPWPLNTKTIETLPGVSYL